MSEVATGRIGSVAERSAQLAIELRVADLGASITFYKQAGFTLERRTATFAALQIEGRYLLLAVDPATTVGAQPPNLRIFVSDVEAAFAHAQAQGWTVVHGLADLGYGLHDFTVRDPDGYEVRFAALAG